MAKETRNFQAEVSRLLDIVANSLYANKEVFLRELISNASDACDRLRYKALTQPGLTQDDPDFAITVVPTREARTVAVIDNGIGMTRDELVENLGTIAKSGTLKFMEELQVSGDSNKANLIGQFGVGFYAAFVVADKVEVETRRAGESQGLRWSSDGRGEFTIEETDEAPARGTRVRLHLKQGEDEFLDESRLRQIVQHYSDHIAIPIHLGEGENAAQLNTASALWTRPKSEIDEEQYTEFYHHVAHAFDDPWVRLHFKAEGKVEYTCLLFVPSQKPFDLFHPDRKHGVKLYVRRVFITDDCAELVPAYLRFLCGVVDSEDLPLNVSREVLQNNPLVTKIRQTLVKRVLGELQKKAEKAPEEYATFWGEFGAVLKEGLYEDPDQREALLELARFESSGRDGQVSLKDYVAGMKEGQTSIYVMTGDDLETLRNSPQIEGFKAKGVEVLLLADPIDDFWTWAVGEYDGKPFKSVTRGAADLDQIQGDASESPADGDKDGEAAEAPDETAVGTLVAFLKTALEDQVKDVRATQRLTDSACCLVADDGDMDIHLERMLRQHGQKTPDAKRILEINPKHPLIRRLTENASAGKAGNGQSGEMTDAAWLLFDQARIVEGETPSDPAAFARRLSQLVAKGLAA